MVGQKFCPDLFHNFLLTKDLWCLEYMEYFNVELLGTVFYKWIARIESIWSMILRGSVQMNCREYRRSRFMA